MNNIADLFKYFTVVLFFSFLPLTNIYGQKMNNEAIISKTTVPNENYSKTDWSSKGIFGKFKPSDEIIELRDRTSKHFLNPDGTRTAIISSGYSLNYYENGKWNTILRDITLNNNKKYSQFKYSNSQNTFKTYYPDAENNIGIVSSLKEGDIYEWINPAKYYLVDGKRVNINLISSTKSEVSDNEIKYLSCFDNIDIKFVQNNDGRKMDIILNNIQAINDAPANATYLVFEETIKLPTNWIIKENEGCLNLYNENNARMVRYEKPHFFDNRTDGTLINNEKKYILANKDDDNNIFSDYSFSQDKNIVKIMMLVPVQWLKDKNRKYPVIVDPTATIYPASSSFYTGTVTRTGGGPQPYSYTKSNDSMYQVCNTPYNPGNVYTMGFMKFDLSSISTATSISSGTINYYCYAMQSVSTQLGYLSSLSIDPVTSTAANIFSNGTNVMNANWSCSSCWYNWTLPSGELTNIFNEKTSTGWAAYKIVNGNSSNWYNFYGYSNFTYKPYLTVNYCVTPGSPTTLSAIATGLTSVNISWASGTPAGSPNITYNWQIFTTGGISVTSGTTASSSVSVSGLICSTLYYFKVQANTNCDNSSSAWVTSSNFSTNTCCINPGIPDTLSSAITSQTSANIQWTAGTPAGSPTLTYYWQIYTTGGTIVTSGNTASLNASVTGLICGTMYYFKVQTFSSCGSGIYSGWATSNNFITDPCDMTVPSSGSSVNISCSGHIFDYGGPTGNYGDNWNGYSIIYPSDTSKAVQLTGTYSTDIYDTIKIFYGAGGIGGTLLGSFAGTGSIPVLTSSGANIPLTISFVTNGSIEGAGFDFTISCATPCSSAPNPTTMLTSDINNFCSNIGGNITLTASGGNGNTLFWYKGNCAGISVGTGNPLILNAPTVSVVYYASWYISGCTNSSCKSVTVLVITAPVAPVSARVDTNNYCSNYSGTINLSASGGSGTKLVWYTTSCGGTQIGTGISLTLPAPTFSISYYTNWQTVGCNNTTCVSINLNVLIVPSAPIIAMTDRNNFCSNAGGNISLSVSGGNGINVGWYRVSCGGTLVGSGNPKVLTAPTSSITYWARWESTCGNSTCASVYITVLPLSVAPVSVSVDRNNLCTNDGGNINLSSSGGSGVSINWFTASCGGTAIGTGKIYTTPTPTTTTTYWVRWTNTCGNSTCKSIIETIFSLPSPPVTVSSDRNNFCSSSGGSVTLSSSGGTGIMLSWYGISCNYGAIGTGNTLIINAPTTTSTYWVNWQSTGCANSTCISVTVTVISGTITPVSALSDRDTICANDGSTINLSVSGGLGTTVGWYTVSCGGTLIGTGNPINLISPTITTTYWANRQSSGCTNSSCISLTEIVNPAPIAPLSLSSDNNNFCLGSVTNITLSTSGGSGTASQWSSTSCGGTIIGTGNQIIISAPSSNTVYYNWWQIVGCNNSSCLSISIVLNSNTTIPTTVTAVPLTVCPGTASVLTETGGTLGTGANWYWYSGTCGGTLVGTSNITTQYPTTSTTYWIRGQGLCNTTGCLSRRVLVSTAISSVTLTGSASVCPGSSQTYYATLYAGYVYTWSAPTGWTGTSTSNSIVFIIGTTPGLVSVIPSNTCGTGAVSSKYVSLNDTSVTPTSLVASPSGICLSGSGSTITLNGGYLGTGGIWKWYSGSCGVTSSGTGISVTKNPTVNTVYWVRAEGTCNSTHCLSITITINSSSTIAVSVNASPSTICNGSQSTLTETGGVLGTGANWYWYSGFCGGTIIGTNSTLTQNPTITSTYYVRAEGTCNTTVCLSVTVNVNNVPPPVGLISGVTTACSGSIQTYSVSLTSGITYNWSAPVGWTGASMSNSIMYTLGANSGNITFTPSNSCGNGVASSIYVNVNTFSVVPTSVNASPSNVCPGSPTTLTETGGTLGSGANWYWYSGSCGGSTPIGTGASITQYPAITTTYQVRAEGTCNTTTCWVVNVTVNTTLSTVPTSISALPSSMCTSGVSTLTETGGFLGTNAFWRWYSGTCGGIYVGSGVVTNQNNTSTTIYFIRAEGTCNTTTCLSVTVSLIPLVAPTSVTAIPSTICVGASSSLNAISTSNTVSWWTASSGGVMIGTSASGTNFVVSPTITTTYYAESGQYTFNSQTFSYVTSSIITWTVPTGVSSINIDLRGASGGYTFGTTPGNGARMVGSFSVTAGQTLSILIGQSPGVAPSVNVFPAGGGGSFIALGANYTTSTPMIVAGGGGASYTNGTGVNAPITTSGTGTNPGTNGNGAPTITSINNTCGGGGGGFYSTGTSELYSFTGGSGFQQGGAGGAPSNGYATAYQSGGFGGGAPADFVGSCNLEAGSGGGYSGGSAYIVSTIVKINGEAGGSYNSGFNQINTAGYNNGNGQAIISWFTTGCNSATRTSVSITVNTLSTPATSVTANPMFICSSGSTNLTESGGVLGYNAIWTWYTGSCGGTILGTGVTITISPTTSTLYYVRAIGSCNTTTCLSVMVVYSSVTVPVSVTATPSSFCQGASSSLNATSSGNTISWFNIATGGAYIGTSASGVNFLVTPTVTTTYYAESDYYFPSSQTFSFVTTSPVTWTVPTGVSSITIDAKGASGGFISGSTGGRGVEMIGTFAVVPGNILSILIGQCPGLTALLPGGGGGTFVALGANYATATPLIVAGGGGGSYGGAGVDASITTSGTGTNPGTNGSGSPSVACGGGGGGFYSSGGNDGNGYYGGTGFQQGGAATGAHVQNQFGGVGGGAEADISGTCRAEAGAGGGYSGGSGVNGATITAVGQGGGSINNGTNPINTAGANTGNGQVIITWNAPVCASSSRTSITIIVNNLSTLPASATASPSTICVGNSSTLTEIGGLLGTGANWLWYTLLCGGTYVTSGISPVISPTITTTYYIRAEGICNTSLCVNTTVTVNTLSTNPISASAIPASICLGAVSTLNVTGGTLGTSAHWLWYTNSCGGTYVFSGFSPVISPTITTTYYVRAESACNSTVCVSTIVAIYTLSTSPTSALATPSVICSGTASTLNATGGTLGINANWMWYSSSCGGAYVISGFTPVISPSITTTYYVRAEGTCNTTTCTSTIVTVNIFSSTPTSSLASPAVICSGASSTLNLAGGVLGSGATWSWYSLSCGGTYVSSGTSPVLNPVTTTTYYVRAEGTCNTTLCVSTIVTVNTSSSSSSAFANPLFICPGDTSMLNVAGGSLGTGANWFWYTSSCGGFYIISGATPLISPSITTTYYVRAEGICNTTLCTSTIITVNNLSSVPTSALAAPPVVCSGVTSSLYVAGGILGTGASWFWYISTCGGTYFTSGASPVISPTNTTTYYVRAEGTCNTSLCASAIITVNSLSSSPTSALAAPAVICSGASSMLNVAGGNLGTGASWFWYTSTCGGNYIISGSSPIISPTLTTTYFVRAEGICNTSLCVSTIITVNNLSSAPTSALAAPGVICPGSTTSLFVAGGSLGTGGFWVWYSASCGIAYLTSGIAPVISPTISNTYYVRAEGICNTSLCVSTTITVNNLSSNPTSALATPAVICLGNTSTIIVTGGTLGTGASWFWYTSTCGGSYIISGASSVISPTLTTTYFVRAEGTCNTSLCVSTIVTVNNFSSSPTFALAAPAVICPGVTSTLNATGGSLGTGGYWAWYSASCGGTYVATGISTVISPIITTSYYVRAEGTCNTSLCTSTIVTVNNLSSPPTSALATPAVICPGATSTLIVAGGSLGTGANWLWYNSSCGGSYVTSGAVPVINPSITTTYYVRSEGTCNTSLCVSTIVTVNNFSSAPTSALASLAVICSGSASTLNISDGYLGTGASWVWYSASCGGNFEGSGTILTVSPTVNITYFARAEGTCNTTNCVSVIISVNTLSVPATSATGITPICYGSNTTLGITNGFLGTEATWYWYTGFCESSFIITGVSPVLNPTISTTYFVSAQGFCNTTTCVSVSIDVILIPEDPISANAVPDTISSGQFSTLSVNGTLSSGENWNWYLNSCGTGSTIGSGSTIVVNPPGTTTYFVRSENNICYSNCVSVIVTIPGSLNAPTSLTATPNPICSGQTATTSLTGALNGGQWHWYTMSCGGSSIGSGISLVISPTITTTYFARQELGNLFSSCGNVLVSVNTLSTSAISATGITPICHGISTTLGISGGSLGTGAVWLWYSSSCGGNYVISGDTPVVSPTLTATYYVRAEGTCNTTLCISTIVTVNTLSYDPTSVTASPANICSGDSSTLTVSGGSLGTDANWFWYTSSCGGAFIISGVSLAISPTITTLYYVRAEGICNTTLCLSTIITVNTLSFDPISVTASPAFICSGATSTLNLTSGLLGTGADWYWYRGFCGGTSIGNGSTIIVNPSINEDYFIRAEGICNTTSCDTISIIVLPLPENPASISTDRNNLCSNDGGIINLSLSGGSGDFISWFTGACGQTQVGNGVNILLSSPNLNTTYFANWQTSSCGNSLCLSLNIIVVQIPDYPVSANANPDTIFTGQSSTITVNGILTTGALWEWYENYCGVLSSNIGNGSSVIVTPSTTTTYYIRAENGNCYSNCIAVEIIVSGSLNDPGVVTSTPDSICEGQVSSLNVTNILNGGNWYWYSGSCGSTLIGTGNNINVSPVSDTTFFVRQESGNIYSSCSSVIVNVYTASVQATSVSASLNSICSGFNTTLGLIGGSLGSNANWYWYIGTCGGSNFGSGTTQFVSPTVNTDYFVRAEGICNTTLCADIIINVSNVPSQPDSIIGNSSPVSGTYEVYSVLNVPGVTYIWTAPSGWVGSSSGNSITYFIGAVTGSVTVTPSNICGDGQLMQFLIYQAGYSIDGYFTYDNSYNTPLDSVIVFLSQNNNKLDSMQADINGYYKFNNLPNGVYNISATTHKPWAGVNSTDAVKVKRHFAGSEYFTSSIHLHAADVNLSYSINTTDAVKITRRFVGSDTSFNRGDWIFEKPLGGDTLDVSTNYNDTVVVNGNNVSQNFTGTCVGDVNGSYLPLTGAKSSPKVIMEHTHISTLNSNEYYDLPVMVSNDINVSAISLILNYPKDLIDIIDVNMVAGNKTEDIIFKTSGNILRLGWFETNEPLNTKKGEILFIIKIKTKNNFKYGDFINIEIENDPLCELADITGNTINNVTLNTYSIEHIYSSEILQNEIFLKKCLKIFPNPTNNTIFVNYNLDKEGFVSIALFNELGNKVLEMENGIQLKGEHNLNFDLSEFSSGVYTCKMILNDKNIIIKRVIILK